MRPFAMNPVTFELTVGLDGNARSGQGVLAAYVPASDFGVPVCLLSNDPRHEPETGIEEITPPLLAHIRDSIDDSEPLWCWCIIDSRGCFREALPKWQPHGFPTVSFQSFAGGFNIDAFLGVTGPAGEAAMELLSKMLDIPATDSDSPSEREFLEKVEVHGNLPAPGNIFRKVDAAVAKGDVRLVAAAIQPDPGSLTVVDQFRQRRAFRQCGPNRIGAGISDAPGHLIRQAHCLRCRNDGALSERRLLHLRLIGSSGSIRSPVLRQCAP
jgi:hypothetical protein